MKRLAAFLLLILIAAPALAAPKIDRSKDLMYPGKEVGPARTVYVCLKSGYAYHHRKTCSIEQKMLNLTKDDFIAITKYEAMLRGFLECPDCSDDVRSYDVDELENIAITVDNIDENLNELIDFLVRLFTGE